MCSVTTLADFVYLLLCLSYIHKFVAAEQNEYTLTRIPVKILEYKLRYTPNFTNRTFTSQCVWVVETVKPVKSYEYFAKNIIISGMGTSECTPATLKNHKRYDLSRYKALESNDISQYSLNSSDQKQGKYCLEFNQVDGSLENDFRGFYYDEYPDENGHAVNFLNTQFGPFGARYAFPSYDEPHFRAQFQITLIRPSDYTCVISNAELKMSIPSDDGTLTEDVFEVTQPISPSSVAFTISKMEVSPKVKGSIHRIVARREFFKSNQHGYVASLINRVYNEIRRFLKVNCELKYFYHVALPSDRMKFQSLGSYRGINHYKERILNISNATPPENQEVSAIAITKLIAQQWFLSYLMVDSWTWFWVNEGLTNYLSYKIVAEMYPDLLVPERLLSKTRAAMQDDSKCCCKSLDQEAIRSTEIEEKVNKITLYKGTALIIMMQKIIPSEVFEEGLKNLINDKKWSTYTSEDLYKNMDSILKSYNFYENSKLPNSLPEIMSTWESQGGHPVLTVTRNYSADAIDKVNISQERFYFDKSRLGTIWTIPINYATTVNPNFTNTKPTDWLNVSSRIITIKSIKTGNWLIFNNQATYYYRVNYDENNWKAISKALRADHQVIHRLNRMQIIDDVFNLAEYGTIEYSIALDISEYIKKERDYGPLQAMKDAFRAINIKLTGSEPYNKFQIFIKTSVEHIYDEFQSLVTSESFNATKKFHSQRRTMILLFRWLCELKSPKCDDMIYRLNKTLRSELLRDFEMYRMCSTMRAANGNKWEKLFDQYKSFKYASSKNNIFNALSCSTNRILQNRFLDYIFVLEKNRVIKALRLIIGQGSNGMDVVIKFIANHFDTLINTFVKNDVKEILNDIGSRVITEKHHKDLIQLSKKNTRYGDIIKPSISRAQHNINWRKKYVNTFEKYLNNKKSIGIKPNNDMHMIVLLIVFYSVNLILR